MSFRDLRKPERTSAENAKSAAISRDDIEHARQQVKRDSERLGRMLEAEEPTPEPPTT